VIENGAGKLFLIAQDVVRFAKEEGISIGPGHGAAAGSLVCYVTGITGIDPLQHGLLFERFVSRGTAGRMPEFEFDVAHRRRDDLVQLVLRRLGPERAVQAASLPTLSTRSVVREVAHAMGLSAGRIDTIARTLHSEGTTDLWQRWIARRSSALVPRRRASASLAGYRPPAGGLLAPPAAAC
jgi:DNA polymerase-3 subunit alpha